MDVIEYLVCEGGVYRILREGRWVVKEGLLLARGIRWEDLLVGETIRS